jgi:hypothetical protein
MQDAVDAAGEVMDDAAQAVDDATTEPTPEEAPAASDPQ